MSKKILVMSKPRCVQCDATYRMLDRLGVEYEVLDISLPENSAELQKALNLGYSAAPIVFVGDNHWSGYRPDQIKEAVKAQELVDA